VGKLGECKFKKGHYVYTGSALGTGGFKRVTRHFNVASGKNNVRKWHIDHLLPHSEVIRAVLLPTNEDLECRVAKRLGGFLTGFPGFGCSDCTCITHLFFSEKDPEEDIVKECKFSEIESIIINPHI
jgi:Uri superfamily endonuclease